MADEPQEEEATEEKAAKGSPLPWIIVTLLCGGLGVGIPFLLPMSPAEQPLVEEEPPPFEPPEKPEETTFIPFDSVVANIDEGQLTRYLRVTLSLEVAKEKELEITELIKGQMPVLKNWLINNISDKTLTDIRGGAGQNRLKREIRDSFNEILFPDGFDQIYNVLLDEYNIQ